jgi:hypothetical protein
MDPVVVSYFPGAGGFRFIHHLLGKSFDQNPQSNYHQVHRVNDQLQQTRSSDAYQYLKNWQFMTGIDMDFNCYLKPTDTINTSI